MRLLLLFDLFIDLAHLPVLIVQIQRKVLVALGALSLPGLALSVLMLIEVGQGHNLRTLGTLYDISEDVIILLIDFESVICHAELI